MQFKIVALAALAAGVSAQAVPSDVQASVLSVLLTALPPSALSLAATNQPAFESEIISSLSAGKTPEWYQALPTNVKSLLTQIYPASTPAATTAAETESSKSSKSSESSESSETPVSTASGSGGSSGGNTTSVTTVSSATLTSGGGASSGAPSSTGSTGGASYPTAVVGAGLAGAAGFIAMLAL